ncbi:MAG: UDP-glucose/GDP-mannose dehydrogenase family protein [Pseudomonadota bacterium]
MNISVIGSGYVGLVTGACFAEFGLKVTCIDNDTKKIELLNNGKIPIYEPRLAELIQRNLAEGRISFTSDFTEGIKNALVIFIAVGTPPDSDGNADLTYIKEVAKSIGQDMDGYKVVVTKSTVPVGTGKLIETIIRENQARPIPYDVASNPEFLREGSAIEDFMRPNRVVIGADSDQAIAILKDLYSPLYLIETPFVITNVATAEMIKYASNAFLATKISFINEMANLCERVGADVHKVAKGMGLDNRIGQKFLHPGPGFGGSCFPKDTKALCRIAGAHGYRFRIVESVVEVNSERPLFMAEKIEAAAGDLGCATVAILGLTFKPNTDDMRDSPSIPIIQSLQKKGARIKAYDPEGMEQASMYLKEVEYAKDAYAAACGADVLVFVTEWNQFRNLDWARLLTLMKRPVVIDLRNIYDPARMKALGINYSCIGRP